MSGIKIFLSVIVGKTILLASRFLNQGGGTAAPGLVALNIHPDLLIFFAHQFSKGTILITGTNGKTTTARILASILQNTQISFIHNRTGSNLDRGLTSACLQKAGWQGKIHADYGVFEIDEAAFSQLAPNLSPQIVVILNLFRDQLDRYGEIDTILKLWRQTLEKLPLNTTIILNSDDPSVASLGKNAKQKIIYFGLRDQSSGQTTLNHASDATCCPHCLNNLIYDNCFISHLGIYRCPHCGSIQPQPQIIGTNIRQKELQSLQFETQFPNHRQNFNLPLPGLYNLYNALAATAVATTLSIPPRQIQSTLQNFHSPFGRVEKIKLNNGKSLQIFLIKNPAGFNEVLRTLNQGSDKINLLIAINDLIADGRDVSWLWDVDTELIVNKVKNVLFSGLRAQDMALRWQYSLPKKTTFLIENNLQKALFQTIENTPSCETLFVLPTYTALLALRKILYQKGLSHEIWQD